MILINLLPPELKNKGMRLNLSDNFILMICGAVVVLVLCLNLILWFALIFKNMQYSRYWKVYSELKPQKEKADILRTDIRDLEANRNVIRQITSGQLIWSRRLNKISECLPRGMWLTNLEFGDEKFTMTGNVISENGQEVGLIRVFLNQLTRDASFLKGILSLELDSVTRKEIKGFEVSEFVISGELNAKK